MQGNRLAVAGAVFFSAFMISSYLGSTAAFIGALCFAVSAVVLRLLSRKTAAFVCALAFASFTMYGIYSAVFIEPVSRLFGNTYDTQAKIISVSSPENDSVSVTAKCEADGIPLNISFYYTDIGMKAGDTANITVKLSEPVISASYSSDYNYSHGVFARSYVSGADITSRGDSLLSVIPQYSAYLRENVRRYITGDECGLMLAMCFGDRSRLSADMSDAVLRSGLSHMTAVSGLHISVIVVTIVSFIGGFSKKNKHILCFVSAVVLSAVFVIFFDAKPSVCRSAVMLIIHYGSFLFRRGRSTINALGAAVLLILLIEPYACRDAGLMLSVCGTFGAGVLAPRLCERLKLRFGALPHTAETAVVCFCASLCTVPLSSLLFGGMSLVSVFSSVIIAPFFTAVMAAAIITAATGGAAAGLMIPAAGVILRASAEIIRFMGGGRYSYIAADESVMLPFITVSAVFVTVAVILSRRVRKAHRLQAASVVICVCVLAGALTAHKLSRSGITEISVYSDGRDFLVSVSDEAGISAFASDINRHLSSAAYDTLASHGRQSLSLLCIITEKKRSEVYSEAFSSISAAEKHFPDNTENIYDISGRYRAEVYEDAVCLDINGVSVLLTDAASAPVYGGHDIALYSGYKKSVNYAINGITVLCDKRCAEPDGAVNAYFDKTVILIDKDGKCQLK